MSSHSPSSCSLVFHRLTRWLGLLALMWSAGLAMAQSLPGDADISFNPDVNGDIWAMTTQADGKIIIGGDFTSVGGVTRNRLARLNADGTLDSSFNPNVNDTVTSIAVQADGRIIIGGLFTSVGGTSRTSLARLQASGSLETAFNLNVVGHVYSLAIQKDGKILVGGNFTSMSSMPRNMLARVSAEGTLDTTFSPQIDSSLPDPMIRSIMVQADGKILAGGSFDEVAGFGQAHIVRLEEAYGQMDFTFLPTLDGGLTAMLLQEDGKVVIAGVFTDIDGNPYQGLARLDEDGFSDGTFIGEVDGVVYAMTQQADGKLILGGDFTHATGGSARNRIARVDALGALDSTFDPNADGDVYALALQADGRLLLAGDFITVDSQARNRLARVHNNAVTGAVAATSASRVEWQRGGSAPEVTDVVFEVSKDGGSVYQSLGQGTRTGSGGWELTGAGLPANGFIRARGRTIDGGNGSTGLVQAVAGFPVPGSLDLAFAPSIDTQVLAMAVQADGKILVGGTFTQINGTSRTYLARLLKDGTLDSSFMSNSTGPDNAVGRLAVQPDGKILITGSFQNFNGQPCAPVIRLNADGTLDSSFNVGNGPAGFGDITVILPLPDGKIMLGGYFDAFNGQPDSGAVRLNANGSVDTSFVVNVGGDVYALAVQLDGKVIIGGDFSTVNSQAANGIARLNTNGTLDSGFNIGSGANGLVFAVAVQGDGKVLMTGTFTSVNSQPRPKIARLNSDGTVESVSTFDPGIGPAGTTFGGALECLAVQADGKILIAGDLTFVNGEPRNGIARLNSDGSVEDTSTFDIGTGVSASLGVGALALDAEGGILITGAILGVNDVPRSGMARLVNHTATQTLSAPSATTVRWLRGGTAQEASGVSFELSTNAGSSWTVLGQGSRTTGGWELSGLSLPSNGVLRARAVLQSGVRGGSAGIVEAFATFGAVSLPGIAVYDGNSTSPAAQRGDNAGPVNVAATTASAGATRTFTIENTGSSPLLISSVSFEGANTTDFSVAVPPSSSVAAGSSTVMQIRFAPASAGLKTATARIQSNVIGSANPFEIPLRGTGLAGSLADSFASRLNLGSLSPVSINGSNTTATLEDGEKTFGGVMDATVWAEWTAPATGWYTVHTVGSRVDTVIALYKGGPALGNLTVMGFNDYSQRYLTDYNQFGQQYGVSRLVFRAQSGVSYKIAVGGSRYDNVTNRGTFVLTIEPEPEPSIRVTSADFSPASVNVSTSSQMVTLDVTVESNSDLFTSGTFSASVLDASVTSSRKEKYFAFTPLDRISGTGTNGLYRQSISLPRYLPAAPWVARAQTFDMVNFRSWTPEGDDLVQDDHLIPPPSTGRVDVTNPGAADTVGPQVISVTGFPAVVNVTSGDETFDVDITFTDNLSGLESMDISAAPAISFYGFGLTSAGPGSLVSGNALSGVWRQPVRVPQDTASGTYYVEITPTDQALNESFFTDKPDHYMERQAIPPEPAALTFQVIGVDPQITVQGPDSMPLADGGPAVILSPAAPARTTASYDFSGTLLSDEFDVVTNTGGGTLRQAGGTLEFFTAASGETKKILHHRGFKPRYDQSWSIEATATIPQSVTVPTSGSPYIDNGVLVSFTTPSGDTYLFASALSMEPGRSYIGLYSVTDSEGNEYELAQDAQIDTTDTSGVVRVRFDAATKHLFAECGTRTLLTLDLSAAGWGMTATDTFNVGLGVATKDVILSPSEPVTLDDFKGALISPAASTFTIANFNEADLYGLEITKSGTNAADFIVEDVSSSVLVLGGALQTGDTLPFTVRVAPGATGTRSATLHIASNDPDESPFDIPVTTSGSVQAPTALTLDARSVTRTSGTLRGLANPNGAATTVTFEYGTTVGYGTSVAAAPGSIAGGGGDTIVTAALTSLVPGTTYHYRVKAVNTQGTTLGADRTFTTPLNIAGEVDGSFAPTVNGEVIGAAVQPDGKVIITGDFSQVNGVARTGIARLNANGTLDNGFNPVVDIGIEVAAVRPDGKIWLGGFFTTVNGQTRNHIARLNADGTLDAAFNASVNGPVLTIVPMMDGRTFIGGAFTQVGGQSRTNIARLHADDTVGSFNTATHGLTLDDEVHGISLQPDGKILVAGGFTNAGSSKRVARFNDNASLDTSFVTDVDDNVRAMVLQPDGKVLIGGDFTSVSGHNGNYLARLLTTGAPDTTFVPQITSVIDGWVNGIALQADGKILIAGPFSDIDAQAWGHVARLQTDGHLDTSFGNPGVSHLPTGVTLRPNGAVLVGGSFGLWGVGQLSNDAATSALSITSPSRVQWLRGGSAPEASTVTFEVSTNGGSSWTLLGAGTRIAGGWECTGITLPGSGRLRARARTHGAYHSNSSSLIEAALNFSGLPAPEIAVYEGTVILPANERQDNVPLDLGPRIVGAGHTRTFTIRNAGSDVLSGIGVTLTGTGDFSVTPPGVTTLAAGATTSFTVTFTPATPGVQSQTVLITSNDVDEATFDIPLSGHGQIPPSITLHPTSVMRGLGLPLSLTGAATGTAVQLQWLCNGSAVGGATAGTFSITGAAIGHAGEWQLRASNGVGTAVSQVAHVGVVDLSIRTQSITAGGTLILQVPAAAPHATYRWLRGGVAIPRGINPEALLILPGIASDQAGFYSLQVTMPDPQNIATPLVMSSGAISVLVTGGGSGGVGAGPGTLSKPVVAAFDPGPWISGAEVRTRVAASHSPTRYSIKGLPPGVRWDARTGAISGRPTTILQAPKSYALTITATNAAGTSLPLETSVVVQPLPGLTAGTFHGAVARHETVNAGHGGRFQLTVSPLGALTGRLTLGAASHGFSGKIDSPEIGRDATATVVIPRARPQTALTLKFTIARLTGELTGTISGSAEVTAEVQAWHQSADAAPLAGVYPVSLTPAAEVVGDARFPQTAGSLRLTISRGGTASWAGRLADGSGTVGSSGLTTRGSVPVSAFNIVYRNSLQGWLQLETDPRSCSGSLDWLRTSATRSFPLHTLDAMTSN